MPRLEILGISFHSPAPSHEVAEQVSNNPTMMYVTLPNLRWFAFGGVSAYLEALLSHITTPLLERLQIRFFHQPTATIAVSQLLQFMEKTKSLKTATKSLPNRYFTGYIHLKLANNKHFSYIRPSLFIANGLFI